MFRFIVFFIIVHRILQKSKSVTGKKLAILTKFHYNDVRSEKREGL